MAAYSSSVSRLLSARWWLVASSPSHSSQAYPKKNWYARRKLQKKLSQAGVQNKEDQQTKAQPVPYSSSADTMKRGEEQWRLLPGPQLPRGAQLLRLHLSLLFPLSALPELPFRHPHYPQSHGWHVPSYYNFTRRSRAVAATCDLW